MSNHACVDSVREAEQIAAQNEGWVWDAFRQRLNDARTGRTYVVRYEPQVSAWLAWDPKGCAGQFTSPRAAVEALGFTLND